MQRFLGLSEPARRYIWWFPDRAPPEVVDDRRYM
jgi:hypothetical protein